MRWLLLVSLFTALYADLPSCARARCLHCEVEFISRMCPDVCSRCPGRVQSPVPQNTIPRQPAPIYRQPQPQQPVPTPPQRREAPQPPPAQIVPPPRPQQQQQQQQQQHFVQLQQTHYLPTQNQPQAQQFAAPNTQLHPIPPQQVAYQPLYAPPQHQPQQQAQQQAQQQQYQQFQQPQQPQYQQYQRQIVVTQPPPPPAVTPSREQAVTLAPLIQMPSAEEINQQLVAQQRILSNGLYSQVPRAAQAPEPQQQATQQSTQQNTLFPGLFPNQQPSQSSSQTSPFFNPFQPFLQNLGLAPSAPSASNPFGLPTFPPNQFFSTTAPTPQQQYNQASYYGVNGQQQQQRSPYGVQQQQQQQQQQQYQGYQQASQSKALATNSIQQSTNYAQQGNQVVARSIDSSPQTYEKNFYAGVAKPQVQYPQCPRQPGWLPCIGKQEANQRFANCCARLGEGCMPLCNYDANLATMQLNVLTGRCPLQKVHDIMICASGYKDVTQCCEAYNVFEPGFEHCRPYCNPAGGLPEGGLLSEKYKCLGKLSYIQQCFYVSQNP